MHSFGTNSLFTSLHLMRHFYFPLTLKLTFRSPLQRNHVMLLVSFCISGQRRLQSCIFFHRVRLSVLLVTKCVAVYLTSVFKQRWHCWSVLWHCRCAFNYIRMPSNICGVCCSLNYQMFWIYFCLFFPLRTDINISPQIVMNTSLHSHT